MGQVQRNLALDLRARPYWTGAVHIGAAWCLAAAAVLAGCAAQDSPGKVDLAQVLADELPAGVVIESVDPTPIDGLMAVRIGAQMYYASEDGRYLVMGNIYDRETKANLTAEAAAEAVSSMLANVPRESTQVYAPEAEASATIYVFTDPSCPYCQQFHDEVPALVGAGVEVVYLGFPRAGVGSHPYAQLTAAYCSEDPVAAFDSIMADPEHVPASLACLSPVNFHLDLAARLDVRGTPAIFDGSGKQIGGYLSADQVLAAIGKE